MRATVEVRDQVRGFIAGLAPEPRKTLRAALRALERGQGDVKALDKELAGFWRLRVGSFRILYTEETRRGARHRVCVFCERRPVVYAIFTELARLFPRD